MRFLKYSSLIAFILLFCSKDKLPLQQKHECRFWGIIHSQKTPVIDTLIRNHLNALRQLGFNNPDGWGMGYYLSTVLETILPVIRRGEPEALNDPRYLLAMEEVVSYTHKSALAHVRRRSSGPTTGIPDPHPFRRNCINRSFDMLFAHNGTISVDVLLMLINKINPFYINLNPPDYSPNHLDSDLFSILLVEVMDTYLNLPIEECIRKAIIKLDSALGIQTAQLNFAMTDGKTLWALNFTRPSSRAITVYYYPGDSISDYWIVASQPMDTIPLWVEIPNQNLICLRPNEPPVLIPIYPKFEKTTVNESKRIRFKPNPFKDGIEINYYQKRKGFVEITIYDETGRLVRVLFRGLKEKGEHKIYWDGADEHRYHLKNGIYFCRIKTNGEENALKFVLVN